jgi:hypothetical protein
MPPLTRNFSFAPNAIFCPTCGFMAQWSKPPANGEISLRCVNPRCKSFNEVYVGRLPTLPLTKEVAE